MPAALGPPSLFYRSFPLPASKARSILSGRVGRFSLRFGLFSGIGGWRTGPVPTTLIPNAFAEIRMRTRYAGCVIALFGLIVSARVPRASAQIWKHLMPVSYNQEVRQIDHRLTQENGPWLIMTASFDGENAAEEAAKLADELSERQHLKSYVHDQTFDHSDNKRPGRGLDQYGAPLRTRYQQEQAHEFAVLVGDFPSIDDPVAQKTLERIKTLPSAVLEGEEPQTPMDEVRHFSTAMMSKIGAKKNRGPMGRAFFTRNPLLPREYFVPKGVDDFVAKMNEGVENNLLDCPGRYTVQVATFVGKTVLQTDESKPEAEPASFGWGWGKQKVDPLVAAAENAHLLTIELRKNGWEAYEFHDRTESIVTVGSFDQVGQQLATGQVVPIAPVQKIVEIFGAAYNTPADPLSKIGNDQRTQRRVEDMKQQFNQVLASHNGQIASGLNPKHVKVMRGEKVDRIIPMDVYPHTVDVPRRSVSGAYVGRQE